MKPDRTEEMRAHLAELQAAHEMDAVRRTVFAFVAYGDKVENYFNWLMTATGAALALVFTQWGGVTDAIGRPASVAVATLLMIALLVGLVARFENYQAQTIRLTWAELPKALQETRAQYATAVGEYLTTMRDVFGVQQPPEIPDMDPIQINKTVRDLMPPDFNTGWRAPIWWVMTKVALALTGREKSVEEVGEGYFGTAQAAYRVGSAMWLVVLYQVVLILTAIVALIGLLAYMRH